MTYRIVVRLRDSSLDGQWLQGPRAPGQVKRDGYGFTADPLQAWTFPTQRQAANKARIVDAHMGWGSCCFTQPVPGGVL